MLFKQLFDDRSSTYTYMLADSFTRDAVFIDSVYGQAERDMDTLRELNLKLRYILETHLHADHVTGAAELKRCTNARRVFSRHAGVSCEDVLIDDGDSITFGNEQISVIATPGHTKGCVTFFWRDRLFTGDALLINSCGRTDFKSSDAGKLYDSITHRLFNLPDETLVYPAHDYYGRRVSCIGQERRVNPFLAGVSKEGFVEMMNALRLSKPKQTDVAVRANQSCGRLDCAA